MINCNNQYWMDKDRVRDKAEMGGRQREKKVLLEELAKEDLQLLALAYVYAKNLQMYGEDVTKSISSAIENAAMLDNAYRKGYYDALQRQAESEDEG